MKSKLCTREEVISRFRDGQTIAIGGLSGHSAPEGLIDCLVESGVKDLTIISLDAGRSNYGAGRLIHSHQVKKLITSHIGHNPEAAAVYNRGELEAEFNPMGTLMERMRCAGVGLGGFLTKTGLGTVVEEGKQIIHVDGVPYLLETALHCDISLTLAHTADPIGNLTYRGTAKNSNPVFITSGALSIVEADFLAQVGELPPDSIVTPGVFVDMILA